MLGPAATAPSPTRDRRRSPRGPHPPAGRGRGLPRLITDPRADVVVVGGGHNALVAAAYLASCGASSARTRATRPRWRRGGVGARLRRNRRSAVPLLLSGEPASAAHHRRSRCARATGTAALFVVHTRSGQRRADRPADRIGVDIRRRRCGRRCRAVRGVLPSRRDSHRSAVADADRTTAVAGRSVQSCSRERRSRRGTGVADDDLRSDRATRSPRPSAAIWFAG